MSSQSSKKRSVSNKRPVNNQSLVKASQNFVDSSTRDYSPTQLKKKPKKLQVLASNAYSGPYQHQRDVTPTKMLEKNAS